MKEILAHKLDVKSSPTGRAYSEEFHLGSILKPSLILVIVVWGLGETNRSFETTQETGFNTGGERVCGRALRFIVFGK